MKGAFHYRNLEGWNLIKLYVGGCERSFLVQVKESTAKEHFLSQTKPNADADYLFSGALQIKHVQNQV